jgi:uncharacterized cupredoxin-like copper-binding protein
MTPKRNKIVRPHPRGTPHALELSGPGVSNQKTAVVQPGQSADLAVTLQAGSYDIWCPVPGHRAKGMEVHVDVAA